MNTPHFDLAVIGLGVMGSSALCHAASLGLSTLGIDIHQSPHALGASHEESRLIRLAYYEHPDYVPLLRYSYDFWDQLADFSGWPLRNNCGLLLAGDSLAEEILGTQAAARKHALSLDEWSVAEARRRFPLLRFRDADTVLWEPLGGFLYAERCVKAMLDKARGQGATVDGGSGKWRWRRDGQGFAISNGAQNFHSDKLVLTAGSWTKELYPDWAPHLNIHRVPLFWFQAGPRLSLDANQLPCFGFINEGQFIYGMPAVSEEGVKVGWHEPLDAVADPSQLDRSLPQVALDVTANVIAERIPSLAGKFRNYRMCLYALSPDRHFMIDAPPQHPGLAVGAGFSGHGFKLAPAVGKLLVDYAMCQPATLPGAFLRVSRWQGPSIAP